MKQIPIITVLAGLFLLWANITHAGTVTYSYSSTCVVDCANIGLTNGDLIGGSVVIDDTNIAPNAFIGASDVVSFNFNIGTLSLNNSNAPYLLFSSLLSANPGTFAFFALIASEALFPDTGDYIRLAEDFGQGSTDGQCKSVSCNISNKGTNYAEFGDGSLSVVPLPASALLFGSALIGLGFVHRRRLRRHEHGPV